MHGYWPFEYVLPSDPRQRVFVLFCSAVRPDVIDVAQEVVRYCDTRRPPDHIYLIAPQSEKTALGEVQRSENFLERVRGATRHVAAPKVDCLFFDEVGVVRDSADHVVSPTVIDLIKRRGLTCLIRNHPVFLIAPPSHHFVVPSGGHADVFFRVGSAMADGAAIDFIAFCCLSLIPRDIKHIYCDTGAISPVAYAINALRTRLGGDSTAASVSSFGSYKGLRDFHFRDMDHSVILISVSTTGGLARELCSPGNDIHEKDIVTLFTLCEPASTAKVVCNLRKDGSNPDGFEGVRTYRERDCPFCTQGSTRIVISTEQFLPGRGKTEDLILKVSHSPKWLSAFLQQFVGTGVIRANYKSGDTHHATREVFFDLQAMFTDGDMFNIEPYKTRLWRTVDRVVPARLTRILCLDSPASRLLAERIKGHLGADWVDLEIVNFAEALKDDERHRRSSGATLVVAAAAASGRSLLATSQLLRTIQTNGAISYLVGLARFPDKDALGEVEGNITYGDQPKERGFFVVDQVFLPLVGSQAKTSWQLELELIDKALLKPPDNPTRVALERRAQTIRGPADARGMSDGLFWERLDDSSLVLRPGFAFFDFSSPKEKEPAPPDVSAAPIPAVASVPPTKEKKPSQADVFFTMVAVLHSLRSDRQSSESLFQHEYRRRVLSPRCFDRFNDGVIQGAILRAAHPAELDYSIDEKLSKDMWQVLDTIFSSSSTQVGEATLEFLMALALKRLKLEAKDLDELKTKFGTKMDHPIAKLLWTMIP